MSKGKGITGIIAFVVFLLISIWIKINISMTEDASIIILLMSLLLWGMGLLVPGILELLEIKVKRGYIFLYALIPCILTWFLIYTFVVVALAPSAFMSSYQKYMGLGLGLSVVLGFIIDIGGYFKIQF